MTFFSINNSVEVMPISGNKHTSEIATMALDLLDASGLFKIPHR